MKIRLDERTVIDIPLPGGDEFARLVRRVIARGDACLDAVREDVRGIREKDPAASSSAEVLLLYSGLHAVIAYRLAHALHLHGHTFAARLLSQWTKMVTGVEIHPAALLGRRLFIDHGSGVVIGETAVVGDDCVIYQGVTLGGTGKDTGKRHPTLGDRVIVGAGAKVLGAVKIGDGAKIAAGAVVLRDIPAGCTAVGIPARIVRRRGVRVDELDQVHIPDPISQELCHIHARIDDLAERQGLPREDRRGPDWDWYCEL